MNFNGATSGYPMAVIKPSSPDSEIQEVRVLYVNKPAGVQDYEEYDVQKGETSIGTAADLQELGYSDGVTPHVHTQVLSNDGTWIDPATLY